MKCTGRHNWKYIGSDTRDGYYSQGKPLQWCVGCGVIKLPSGKIQYHDMSRGEHDNKVDVSALEDVRDEFRETAKSVSLGSAYEPDGEAAGRMYGESTGYEQAADRLDDLISVNN